MPTPTTQAEAVALTSEAFRKGGKVIARVANKRPAKCCTCRAKLDGGAMYFDQGLRATTLRERQNARKGLIWYSYCPGCAAKF